MKYLFGISLFFSLLTVFVLTRRESVEDFATHLTNYEVVASEPPGYFVKSVEDPGLHKRKRSTALTAKASLPDEGRSGDTAPAEIHLWQFDFDTQEKRKEATDSLLRCFPTDCAKIERQTGREIRTLPSIWIFTGRNMYIAQTACEQPDPNWVEFTVGFVGTFADKDSEIIVTACGKLSWTTKEEVKNTSFEP